MHKVLIIDDEADHATLNTKSENELFADTEIEQLEESKDIQTNFDSDPSKTNELVRSIIKLFSKVGYVGIQQPHTLMC